MRRAIYAILEAVVAIYGIWFTVSNHYPVWTTWVISAFGLAGELFIMFANPKERRR